MTTALRAPRGLALSIVALAGTLALAPIASRAEPVSDVTFGQPTASAALGSSLQISQPFQATARVKRVELLIHLRDDSIISVETAVVSDTGEASYVASINDPSFEMPNTTFDYQFRITLDDDSTALSPESSVTVQDTRFGWQT